MNAAPRLKAAPKAVPGNAPVVGARAAAPGTPKPARASAPRPARRPSSVSGEVRIIGGQWKRSKLPVAQAPGLRPSADRVRETLFNWLGQDLRGWRCLDAFAGSGALGFEAASRGAAQVLCVEQDRALAVQLERNKAKLGASTVTVQRGDALAALNTALALDLVLLDPPFQSGDALFSAALRAAAKALAPNGWVYLEAPRQWTSDELSALGLQTHRHLKAGMAHAHLLRLAAAA